MAAGHQDLGAVAIGRNEGERLKLCLESLRTRVAHIVYVDSGSSDGSVAWARDKGVEVVELDLSIPFTAGRARNEGLRRLRQRFPEVSLVQFVDGDCEVVDGWLDTARARLLERSELAAVCGRIRERHPEASIYNRICNIEWDTPIGDTEACGGNAMMRAAAFEAVGGFRPELIAGEEPELCLRLRRAGYKIERLDAEMVLHDADLLRVSQWWARNVRAGHAYAEGAHLHGDGPERHWVKESRRVLFWGGVLPAVALGGAVPTMGASLLLLAGYPVSTARNYSYQRSRGRSSEDALLYAASCTIGRFAELQGLLRFHAHRVTGKRSAIIEHKKAEKSE